MKIFDRLIQFVAVEYQVGAFINARRNACGVAKNFVQFLAAEWQIALQTGNLQAVADITHGLFFIERRNDHAVGDAFTQSANSRALQHGFNLRIAEQNNAQ